MNIEEISFKIISSAGDSMAQMCLALQAAKKGNEEESNALMESAKNALTEAHRVQTELLVNEANGIVPEFSILLLHAQDHLMNVILAETIIGELIEIVLDKNNK